MLTSVPVAGSPPEKHTHKGENNSTKNTLSNTRLDKSSEAESVPIPPAWESRITETLQDRCLACTGSFPEHGRFTQRLPAFAAAF